MNIKFEAVQYKIMKPSVANRIINRFRAAWMCLTQSEYYVVSANDKTFTGVTKMSCVKPISLYKIKVVVEQDIEAHEAEKELRSYLR